MPFEQADRLAIYKFQHSDGISVRLLRGVRLRRRVRDRGKDPRFLPRRPARSLLNGDAVFTSSGTEGLLTLRWREPDSNPRSPQEDGYFESTAEELMPCSSSSARARNSPALRGVAQRTA